MPIAMTMALVVQTMAGPAGPEPAASPDPRLSVLPPACPAGPTVSGDVIVCARRRDADRLGTLPPLPDREAADPMTFRLPGAGTGRVHAFQRDLQGASSQGVALTMTIPLGHGR